MEFRLRLDLSETEARALDALTGYEGGATEFIKRFYDKCGQHYMKPHEKGLISLWKTIREELPKHFYRFDEARRVFNKQ